MIIQNHPVLAAPTRSQALSMGAKDWEEHMKRRDRMIQMEEADPLRYGWEPPIWSVVDALLGWEFCSEPLEAYIRKRFGWSWLEFAQRMRARLGFRDAVQMVLILGGNRGGKSEYAAKRALQLLSYREHQKVEAFHMSNPRSVKDQQPLFWKYMPPEWKIQKAEELLYIKYKKKTGFSDNSFINPIDSSCSFGNYMQDKETAIEGLECDLVCPDELIPVDWLETIIYRLATRDGKGITCFTPVNGYTPSVSLFCTGADVAMESTAFLLPDDGGDPDIPSALGLTPQEVLEIQVAKKEGRAATAPRSRPEDVFAWLEDPSSGDNNIARPFGMGIAQMPVPAGRRFKTVPRVLRPNRADLAVVYFHSSDNPFGNPFNVMSTAINKKSSAEIKIRVYGLAEKASGGKFPTFDKNIHVITRLALPKEGTNYFYMDPAGDRNFFMLWIRMTPESHFVYREWPGNYHIHGVGYPGPWAVPSGKKEGRNDGARGEAQEKFDFGLYDYKFEIARIERWEDFKKWCHDRKFELDAIPDNARPTDDELDEWSEDNGADEYIEQRYVDSRAASTPRVEKDRPHTLLTDLDELGFDFMLTPGSDETTGITQIDTALAYDVDEDMSFFNRPRLIISEDCHNLIYALENYTGVDGQKGACRDPIDLLRYHFTGEAEYLGDSQEKRERGGFYYGRPTPSMMKRRRNNRGPDGRPKCMGKKAR